MSLDLALSSCLRTDKLAEGVDFLNDELLHSFGRLFVFEREVEFLAAHETKYNLEKDDAAHLLALGLVVRVVPYAEVRMIQGLLARDALGRVKVEHLLQEVDGERVGVGVERREWDAGLDGQRADVVLCLCGGTRSRDGQQRRGCARTTRRTRGDPTRRRVSSLGVPR